NEMEVHCVENLNYLGNVERIRNKIFEFSGNKRGKRRIDMERDGKWIEMRLKSNIHTL
ncbi:hypothetical protein RUM43_007114, partial [Polyplax serrata]